MNLIESLLQDHRNMARVLKCMELQIENIELTKPADFELLACCVKYLTKFSDRVHHPNEDFVFSHIKLVKPEHAGLVDELSAEHQSLADNSRKLSNMVDAVSSEQMVERASLVEEGQRFIKSQFHHMRHEEDVLFSLAVEGLSESDWQQIKTKMQVQEDPVFGAERDEDLKVLSVYIDRMYS